MKHFWYVLAVVLFSATQSTAQPIFQESFEGAEFPPLGWTETPVEVAGYGIDPDWYRHEGTDLSTYNTSFGAPAHDGLQLACFNSRIASGWCASSRLETPALDLSEAASADLSYWMFHDTAWGWGDCWEAVTVQIDPGTGVWEDLGEMNVRQVGSNPGWREMVLSLDAYLGLSQVRVGFLAVSDQGENIHLDLISVSSLEADSQAPELVEFADSQMPVAAPLSFSLLLSDRSQGAAQLGGLLSFDSFGTSTSFVLDRVSEADPVQPLRRFRYRGLVASPGQVASGEVRILMTDEHGNEAWTEDLPVAWYNPLNSLHEDFERYADFTHDIPPFTQIDVDSSGTWGVPYSSFPGAGYVGSFIIFNPYQTDPPMPYDAYLPHSGSRAAVAFTAYNGNDDWLVSPALAASADLKFSLWARTPDTSWDLERFRVLVSTTANHDPEVFELVPSEHYVSGQDFVEPPFPWTRYEFDLSAWADAPSGYVFVAVNGISPWITLTGLFVDDIEAWSSASPVVAEVPVFTSGPSAHPNPFNPRTTISFELAGASRVDLTVHDVRGRLVRTLVSGDLEAGPHEVMWDGMDNQGQALGSGVYFSRLVASGGVWQNKMVLVR